MSVLDFYDSFLRNTTACHNVALCESEACEPDDFTILGHNSDLLIMDLHLSMHNSIIGKYIEK